MPRGKLCREHYQIIVKNYEFLKEQIEAKDVVGYLFQNNVLTEDDMQRVNSGKTKKDRIETLLDLIMNSIDSFQHFLKSLEKDYKHVFDQLQHSEKSETCALERNKEKQPKVLEAIKKEFEMEKKKMREEIEMLKLIHEKEKHKLNEIIEQQERKHRNEENKLLKEIESLKMEVKNLKDKNIIEVDSQSAHDKPYIQDLQNASCDEIFKKLHNTILGAKCALLREKSLLGPDN